MRQSTIARQVRAELNYTERQPDPLYNYFLVDPPVGMPASNEVFEAQEVSIGSIRDLAEPPRLDAQGFELVPFETSVRDIYNAAEREAVFFPEVEACVKRHTGAVEVRAFYPQLRGEEAQRRMPGAITAPAARVHVDYTHETGPHWFNTLLGADADRFRGRRFAMINFWRPITGPLQDWPLAVCDCQTISQDDLLSMRTVSRADEKGFPTPEGAVYDSAIYSVAYNPAHRWYYAPDMMPGEALLLKNYDSELEGVARFSPHSAFNDLNKSADALPRASVEVRCLTIW